MVSEENIMGQNIDLTVNRLPALTWNSLGVNQTVIPDVLSEGFRRITAENEENLHKAGKTDSELWNSMDSIPTGMGEDVCGFIDKDTDAICISSENIGEEKIIFDCETSGDAYRDIKMFARENETLTVWMGLKSSVKAEGKLALRTKIKASKGANIRLVQVNLLGGNMELVNDIGAYCEDNANVSVLQLFLGGKNTWTGLKTTLKGDKSRLDVDTGYYCDNGQTLDMNYIADHYGKKTESRMNASGVLKDNTHKLYRGTIDFKLGASGSKGDEAEDVLILGDDVINQTVPLILCAEEDVEGNHGATIGRLDDDILFYMASRGINEEDASNLIARARIEALAGQIGDEELSRQVCEYIEEATGYGEEL